MGDNDFWGLVLLHKHGKSIVCKWNLETNRDLNGNKERYEALLVL